MSTFRRAPCLLIFCSLVAATLADPRQGESVAIFILRVGCATIGLWAGIVYGVRMCRDDGRTLVMLRSGPRRVSDG